MSQSQNATHKTPTGSGLLQAFKAFDDAFNKESSAADPVDFEQSIKRLTALVDALPQRPAIEAQHAEKWIDRTLKMAVSRMELEHGKDAFSIGDVHRHVLWHVRRASGIGGSEIGTIVKHFRGETGTFTDARNLVLEKLLIMSPQPSTPEMARGVRAEPWIQKIYQETTGDVTDEEALSKLRGFRWNRLPYVVGTPDDIVIRKDTKLRRMVDYKAPSADVCSDYEVKGISFDYKAQLHHYGIISLAAGGAFHDMSIETHDPRSFTITSYVVPFDHELAREIAASARRIWNDHVMTGIVPDAIKADELEVDEGLVQMGHEAAMLRALKEVVEKREKEMLQRIVTIGTDMHDKAAGKLPLGVADFNRARAWDEPTLTSLAIARGIDIAPYSEVTDKFDPKRAEEVLTTLLEGIREGDPSQVLADLLQEGLPKQTKLKANELALALEEAGVDTISAAGLRESFALTRKSKGPGAEALERLRTKVSDLMEALDDVVADTATKIISGEPDEVEPMPEM